MNDQYHLNREIVLTITKIQGSFPELIKYLDEMPKHAPYTTDKGVDNEDLRDYLNSLNQLLETFSTP